DAKPKPPLGWVPETNERRHPADSAVAAGAHPRVSEGQADRPNQLEHLPGHRRQRGDKRTDPRERARRVKRPAAVHARFRRVVARAMERAERREREHLAALRAAGIEERREKT